MSTFKVRGDGRARTPNYKFTITSKADPALTHLRADVMRMNMEERESFKQRVMYYGPSSEYTKYKKQYWVRVRARGPRDGDYYDTPEVNATRYDVYIGEKRLMRGYDF